jgi:hypothetical protein
MVAVLGVRRARMQSSLQELQANLLHHREPNHQVYAIPLQVRQV